VGNNACFANGRFRPASRKTRTHDIRRCLADRNGSFGAYNSNKRTFGKGTCELWLLTRSSHSTEHISKYCKISLYGGFPINPVKQWLDRDPFRQGIEALFQTTIRGKPRDSIGHCLPIQLEQLTIRAEPNRIGSLPMGAACRRQI
jgi:hypothetical protein